MSEQGGAERIIGACFEGEVESVRELLARDAGLARARFAALDSTALHISAHRGFAEIVELLLAHGADVHAREGCSGTTALHWAAEGGHLRVAEALLAKGAALDARDAWHDQTALDWALFVVQSPPLHDDRAAVAELLEARGARPSIFSAVATQRADAVRAIVARDPAALAARLGPLDGGSTPLVFALERGRRDMAALLLELGADPDQPSARGLGPRATALLAGDAGALAMLDARGAALDLGSLVLSARFDEARERLAPSPAALRAGGTHAALPAVLALHGADAALSFLLEQGAAPDARLACLDLDEWLDEWPALHLAASRDRAECARLLLRHGADPALRAERSGMSALHVAAAAGATRVAKLLLAAGAPVDARSRAGSTALHHAAGRGEVELVSALLSAGADPRARDANFCATPAGWAQHAGNAQVVALLQRGAQAP